MNSLLEEKQQYEAPSAPKALRGGERRLSVAALAVAVLALCVACAALLLQLRAPRQSEPETPAVEEPTVEEPAVIRFRNHVLPVLENVPVNGFAAEAFHRDGAGYLRYADAPLGVDVSSYQGEIDWERVAASGVKFAMIRAGLRGYTKGGLMEDSMFRRNIEGALAAGLDVGVYFFSQAVSVAEAEEEADVLLELVEGYDLSYPLVYDWETVEDDAARTVGVGSDMVTDCARAFCERVAAAGYTPMVYFNLDQGYLSYHLDELTDFLFWLAEYRDCPSFYYHYDFLQYTHQGTVDGIEGYVDLDLDLRLPVN